MFSYKQTEELNDAASEQLPAHRTGKPREKQKETSVDKTWTENTAEKQTKTTKEQAMSTTHESCCRVGIIKSDHGVGNFVRHMQLFT